VTLTFEQARECVLREVRPCLGTESVSLGDAAGRVLAENVHADRDYPPFPRSARDGFAVKAADLPGELRVTGEVRAGEVFHGSVGTGEAVEIMTGAPLPDGADAVVMVEDTTRDGDRVRIDRTPKSGENFTPLGAETKAGESVLSTGKPLGYAEVGLLATVGLTWVTVLPTGDEIVEPGQQPLAHQIRNSNAASLAVQVRRAGGAPEILPIARDNWESTRAQIERGLQSDLLLLSGGVSAGKYDIVERVLAELGAEFFFDRILIQPGQPLVFGRARQKFFFGLPGNPGMQGVAEPALPLLRARLVRPFKQKTGLTRFLPARLSADGSTIEPAASQGSGDVTALARCNAFLVTEPERESWETGEEVRVLLK